MHRRMPDPNPFFKTHVFVCTNRRPDGHKRGSCAAKGSEAMRAYMKVRAKELGLEGVRINSAGCLDRCEAGPCTVIYTDGTWYRITTREEADAVLEQHVRNGQRVPELQIDN